MGKTIEEKNKALVLEAFNAAFNARDYFLLIKHKDLSLQTLSNRQGKFKKNLSLPIPALDDLTELDPNSAFRRI